MDETEEVKVACLYNVCDLQRVCQKNELQFSKETNRFLLHLTVKKLGPLVAQKLVKNLVDKGEIEWNKEEEFEVESIQDNIKDENGDEFYLIKWKGWPTKYNTWEPKEHLDCVDLLDCYHKDLEASKVNGTDRGSIKRRLVSEDVDQPDKRQRINDLMDRILTAPEVTPLKLLTQSPLKNVSNKLYGLMRNHSRVPKFRRVRSNIYNKRSKTHKQLREEVTLALKQWEIQLNKINSDPAPITVENAVDLEGPPATFSYINDYKADAGVIIPDDPIVGCECDNCFDEKKHCCGPNAGSDFAFYKHGRVRVAPGTPIYECNKRCKCGVDCPNRVVQHGRKHKVCLFRTHNGRGWGVKALQKVKKGSFVLEYVGEVITNEEAERRGRIYDAEGRTYLFDLDYNDADCPYTVDAGFYGNVSHFVNHSCDPNLAVYGVWINHLDPRLPRIALFAKRDISKGEELTFDYMMTGDTTQADLEESPPPPEDVSTAVPDETAATDTETPPTLCEPPPINTETPPSESDTLPSETVPMDSSDPPDSSDTTAPSTEASDAENQPPKLEEIFLPPPPPTPLKYLEAAGVLKDTLLAGPQIDDSASDISKATSDVSHDPSEYSTFTMDAPSPFIRRKLTSPSPAMKYRIMCQCGAANCRKYLF